MIARNGERRGGTVDVGIGMVRLMEVEMGGKGEQRGWEEVFFFGMIV